MRAPIGIPYAHANDDGSVTCPLCSQKCEGLDESQQTAEDAITKGAGQVYAEHFQREHAFVARVDSTRTDAYCVPGDHRIYNAATGLCEWCGRNVFAPETT